VQGCKTAPLFTFQVFTVQVDYMPKTEDIEAKLCAYVDGELDATGIAEIEHHLLANPQHKHLITDLMRTRRYMHELPRVAAPVDLAESLHGHIERAALLGDNAGAGGPGLRIGNWPQIRAIAAVLVLAVGLAAILYFMLPSPRPLDPELVLRAPSFPSGSSEARESSGRVLTGAGNPDTQPHLRESGPGVPGSELAESDAAHAFPTEIASNVPSPQERLLSQMLPNLNLATRQPVMRELHVYVSSRDPDAAAIQVREWLSLNNFSTTVTSAEAPPPALSLDETQSGIGSRFQKKSVEPTNPLSDPQAGLSPEMEQKKQSHLQSTLASGGRVIKASGMNRAEIDALCMVVTDRAAGQIAQVMETRLESRALETSQLATPNADATGAQAEHAKTGVAAPQLAPRDDATGGAERDAHADHSIAQDQPAIPATQPDDARAETPDALGPGRSNLGAGITSDPVPHQVTFPDMKLDVAVASPATQPADVARSMHDRVTINDERVDVTIVISADPPTTGPTTAPEPSLPAEK
jgi:hypothetical protein